MRLDKSMSKGEEQAVAEKRTSKDPLNNPTQPRNSAQQSLAHRPIKYWKKKKKLTLRVYTV